MKILLNIRNLQKTYSDKNKTFSLQSTSKTILKNISFTIFEGESLALVGESGCGKTTLGRCLLRLIPCDGGSIFYQGTDILNLPLSSFRQMRKKFQMIFQNPAGSLNPRQTVFSCLAEAVNVDKQFRRDEVYARVVQLLRRVNLPKEFLNRRPHQLSGGQQQRVAIARALAAEPVFLVADEPTSSLDASVKWQIVDLLMELRERMNLTILFITHDLELAGKISNRLMVMHEGEIVEIAPTPELLNRSLHPYSRLLLGASGYRKYTDEELSSGQEKETAGSIAHFQDGCSFRWLCSRSNYLCEQFSPRLTPVDENHYVSCHQIYPSRPEFQTIDRPSLFPQYDPEEM